MPRRLDAIDIAVPAEFAAILYESQLAEPSDGHRSALATMVLEGASVAAVFVTLAQGPPTVMQLRDAFHRWREQHRAGREPIGRVTFRGPRGVIDIDIGNDSDLLEIAELARKALFTQPGTAAPRPDL
jgi:hypothetical protein